MPTTTDHSADYPLHARIAKLHADAELAHAKMNAALARIEAYEAEVFSLLQDALGRTDAFQAGLDKITGAREAAQRRSSS